MPDVSIWITAVRDSHDRFTDVVAPLDETEVTGPSYDTEWSIADVASHLGSQGEIFGMFLESGLTGAPAPTGAAFGPIWDRWNALAPALQVTESIRVNEGFVSRVEGLSDADRGAFSMDLFGSRQDLAGLLATRLGEHALHVWDVAVALDPAATVAPGAVALLIDRVPAMAARAGKPVAEVGTLTLATSEPSRRFTLSVADAVSLTAADDTAPPTGATDLELPAEALLRLVTGRLDAAHTPAGVDEARLAVLRPVFPGF
jgi:uncharacterized protein (TIGR03083 family)